MMNSLASVLVRLEAVKLAYNGLTVFSTAEEVTIKHGQIYAVVGPTGCGKTSLLNLLAGLLKPLAGRVQFKLASDQRRVALIPQDYGLFPWKTVWRNITMGLEIRDGRRPVGQAAQAVHRLMEELGIADLAGRWPNSLSGGQQQRTAIARALAVEPALLLMDEPFNALDADIREDLQELLLSLPRRYGTAIVIVTHDLTEALKVADYILAFQVVEWTSPNTVTAIPNRQDGYQLVTIANDPRRRSSLQAALRANLRAARQSGVACE